jgi:hypothetical protein
MRIDIPKDLEATARRMRVAMGETSVTRAVLRLLEAHSPIEAPRTKGDGYAAKSGCGYLLPWTEYENHFTDDPSQGAMRWSSIVAAKRAIDAKWGVGAVWGCDALGA